MSNDKGPSYFGLVGHYTGCVNTLCDARKNLGARAGKDTIAAVEAAIRAAAGAIVMNVERDKAERAQ